MSDYTPAFQTPEPPPIMAKDATLRDWFAGQAIGPLMGSDGFEKEILSSGSVLCDLPQFAAELAYEIADAMLAERNKKK